MADPESVPREHKAGAPKSAACLVLTISDSKTVETDTSGQLIRELLTKAGHTVDLSALEAHATEHLAGYKRPRSWEIRAELPRTESGKLLKRLLRDEHWQGRTTKV